MKKLLSLSALMVASAYASAADLTTIYEQAASNDAEIAAARATREANAYNVTIARGALLPQLQASYSHTVIDAEVESLDFTTQKTSTSNRDYELGELQIQASQALFNLNSWYTYQAAKTADKAETLNLQLSEQQLLLRTSAAYFDVLRAADNLETAQAEEKAVKRSLEQTRQRYDVGLIAITEVHEAQATYDLTYVNLLSQQAALDISFEALEVLTGQQHKNVNGLKDSVSMQMPTPTNVADWVTTGLEKFPGIQIASLQKTAVGHQRDAARYNRFVPTANLFANYTDGDQSPFSGNDPTQSTVISYGVKVSIPVFAGGSLYGQSKQAAANLAATEYQLESQRRQVKQKIRSLYRQLQTTVQNIDARKQAITSAQSALEATETGYEVGTRNIVEVLDAQRQLFGARRDYANARYDYILTLLNLKFYAGTLNEGDIQALNAWLEA
ncbi:MAG: TolC family outer membrane protein [Oceanobacter sp.]